MDYMSFVTVTQSLPILPCSFWLFTGGYKISHVFQKEWNMSYEELLVRVG